MSTEKNPPLSQEAIEQYKAKLSDLGNLGERQSSMTTYFLSIISAFIGILAIKDQSILKIDISILLIICGAGFLICLLWFLSETYFLHVFRAKLTVLQTIEQTLPYQTFKQESDILRQFKMRSWLRIERMIPVVFGLFFLCLAVYRLAS